jgi:hypothetical protein
MPEPRRYNPPRLRATRCRAVRAGKVCDGDVIAFGESDYDALDGRPPFRARMWHCKRCSWSGVEEVR